MNLEPFCIPSNFTDSYSDLIFFSMLLFVFNQSSSLLVLSFSVHCVLIFKEVLFLSFSIWTKGGTHNGQRIHFIERHKKQFSRVVFRTILTKITRNELRTLLAWFQVWLEPFLGSIQFFWCRNLQYHYKFIKGRLTITKSTNEEVEGVAFDLIKPLSKHLMI